MKKLMTTEVPDVQFVPVFIRNDKVLVKQGHLFPGKSYIPLIFGDYSPGMIGSIELEDILTAAFANAGEKQAT